MVTDTYVVTMYRFGDRERHSYVLGVYGKKHRALDEAGKEETYRGGKYEAEILECPLDNKDTELNYKVIKGLTPKQVDRALL